MSAYLLYYNDETLSIYCPEIVIDFIILLIIFHRFITYILMRKLREKKSNVSNKYLQSYMKFN